MPGAKAPCVPMPNNLTSISQHACMGCKALVLPGLVVSTHPTYPRRGSLSSIPMGISPTKPKRFPRPFGRFGNDASRHVKIGGQGDHQHSEHSLSDGDARISYLVTR